MVAKVAGGIISLGLIGTGGVAFVKPEWLGINKEIPWKPLSQNNNFSSDTNYSNKFGSTHKNYLVGTEESSKAWWEHQVNQIKKPSEGKFKNVVKGFEGNDSLKGLCDEAYKKQETDLNGDTSGGNDNFKKSEVWEFCSPLGQKPTTIKEFDNKDTNNETYKAVSGGTNPIGKEAENDLISVNDKNNNKFWDIRNREFHGKDPFTTKVSISGSSDEFFKQGQANKKDIKDLCREAYTKKSATTSSEKEPTKDETKKYCSFSSIATA